MSKSYKRNSPYYTAAEAYAKWQERVEEREAKANFVRATEKLEQVAVPYLYRSPCKRMLADNKETSHG